MAQVPIRMQDGIIYDDNWTFGKSFFDYHRHQVHGALYSSGNTARVTIGTSATDALNFSGKRGLYLVSAIRSGGATATNGVWLVSASSSTVTLLATLTSGGLTASVATSFFRLAGTSSGDVEVNALLLANSY